VAKRTGTSSRGGRARITRTLSEDAVAEPDPESTKEGTKGAQMAVNKAADAADTKAQQGGTGAQGTKIKWDDAAMKSSYANVCNVTSTREEVVMLFGINQAWNRGQKEVTIQLTDRIIISPYAAKRLTTLLDGVVKEYEKRFGALNVEGPAPQR
jgi:hypothetical protein